MSDKAALPLTDLAKSRVDRLMTMREVVDRELEIYLCGVLAGQGIAEARLIGLNDDNSAIEYQAEVGVAAVETTSE